MTAFVSRSVVLGRVVTVGLALTLLGTIGCGLRHRIPGFGPQNDGTLLVRHTQNGPQEVSVNGTLLGLAQSGGITCFREVPTGTLRIEARMADAERSGGPGSLTRATRIVLTPEQPLLWDIDHDQVFSGRAHARLCGEESSQ